MKNILASTIVAACALASAPAEEKTRTNDVKVSTNNYGDGRATITIESNGKKEVRVIDLKQPETSVFALSTTGGGEKTPVTWLGIASDELSEELAAQLPVTRGTGVIVRHVADDSPAAKVGVQKHDVLLKLDDQIITDARQLQKLVRAKKAGDSVQLTVIRRGEEQKLTTTLTEHAEAEADHLQFNPPVIDIGSGKVAFKDILKNYAAAAGSAGGRANILITSPDGKVVTSLDSGEIKVAPLLKKADAALKESKVPGEILKKVEEALAEIRATAERAGQEAVRAMKQAEEAAQRAAEAARRAEEKIEREEKRPQESQPEQKPPSR